jgi:hypothetical protein
MCDQGSRATTPGDKSSGDGTLFPVHRSWKIAMVVAAIMVVLAVLGVALTQAKSSAASVYWLSLTPVYGLLCVGTAWSRSLVGGAFDRTLILRQLFHWLGIGIALMLDFFILKTGQMSEQGTGWTALLLLALGCYLAGVHLEWLFVLVGVILTLALVALIKLEENAMLIFLVASLAVIAMVVLMRLLGGAQARRKAAPSAPAGS